MSNKLVEACTLLSKYLLTNEFHIVHCICICIRIFDTFKKLTLRNFDGGHFDPHFEALFRFPDVRDSNFKGSCQTGFDQFFVWNFFYGFDLLIVFYSFNAFIARRSKRNSYFLLK